MKRLFIYAISLFSALGGVLLYIVLAHPFPHHLLEELPKQQGFHTMDRHGHTLDLQVGSHDQYFLPVTFKQISVHLIQAILAAEDQRFYEHSGIDFRAISRALWQNTKNSKRISGASTISMQVVKLMHKKPRTYFQKMIEAWHAMLLEKHYHKNQILQFYLNLAPFGGNLVGCEAASRIYFQKPSRDLNLAEASLLAGLPQSPSRYNPLKYLERALERQDYVLERMLHLNMISQSDYLWAQQHKVYLQHPQRNLDHILLSQHLKTAQGQRSKSQLHSTIDPDLQSFVKVYLTEQASNLYPLGIDGLACVVIDGQKSELLAMVSKTPEKNWLNLSKVSRQPGSLFKPFIYALAYQKGILTPEQAVSDKNVHWGSYRPNNHDNVFWGDMSASQALQQSRNLPAIKLLEKLKVDSVYSALQSMDLQLQQSTQELGLSLALGTSETNLLAITNAYATFLKDGHYHPLKIDHDNTFKNRRLFSPQVSSLTLYSLGARLYESGWNPASKTGTSWNQRDAWCIALSPTHAVGIWVGKLNGKGHANITGSSIAKPLAEALLEHITPPQTSWTPLADLNYREVCHTSGAPMSLSCSHSKRSPFIPGVSSTGACRHSHEPNNEESPSNAKNPFTLSSPIPNSQYLSIPNQTTLLPMKVHHNPPQKLFWFINGEHVKTTEPNHHYWKWPMQKGHHSITVSNETGIAYTTRFEII